MTLIETRLLRVLMFYLCCWFVICFQSDAISMLEKEHDYREEHFDFIQRHIRKFCLNCIFFLLVTQLT